MQVFEMFTTGEEWVLFGEEQAWNLVQGTLYMTIGKGLILCVCDILVWDKSK